MDSKLLSKILRQIKDFILGTSKPKPSKREPITGVKSCPYCGRDNHLFTKDNGPRFPDYRIAIFCDKCGFYYTAVDKEICIEEWNDFPRDPEAQQILHKLYK